MPSTYTTNNGIEKIGNGEQSGAWGTTTNTNFDLIDASLDGSVTVTLPATGTGGSPNTLPINDGTSSTGRNRFVTFNDSGDLGGPAFVQLTPNDAEKIMLVENALSNGRDINLFQGNYDSGRDYTIPNGTKAIVKFDGGGTSAVVSIIDITSSIGPNDDVAITGGSINGTSIGASVPAAATFNSLETVSASDLAATFSSSDNVAYILVTDDTGGGYFRADDGEVSIWSGVSPSASGGGSALVIDTDQNVNVVGNDFIVDTSKFYVDVSASSVGINNNSPQADLHVTGSGEAIRIETSAGSSGFMGFFRETERDAYVGFGGANDTFTISNETTTGNIRMLVNGATSATFEPDGTTNINNMTAGNIELNNGSSSSLTFQDSTGTNGYILRANVSDANDFGFLIEDLAGTDILSVTEDDGLRLFRDFRVGSAFFVDDSNDFVGVNTVAPAAHLDVRDGNAGRSYSISASTNISAESSGSTNISIIAASGSSSSLNFGDNASENPGSINYRHNDDTMDIRAAGVTVATFANEGLGIGTAPDVRLHLNGSSGLLRLQSGNGTSQFQDWYDDGGRRGYFGYGGSDGKLTLENEENDQLRFGTNSRSDDIVIFSSGDISLSNGHLYVDVSQDEVGINTSTPERDLHIVGTACEVMIENQNAHQWTLGQGAIADEFSIRDATGGNSIRFHIDGGGNVGVGTAQPIARFEADSGADNNVGVFTSTDSGAIVAVQDSGGLVSIICSGGDLLFGTNGTVNNPASADVGFSIDASQRAYVNSGYGSREIFYGVRVWAQVNSGGTIRESGGVSSVTRVGTGVYSVSFDNTMPDDDYSAQVTVFSANPRFATIASTGTTSCQVNTYTAGGSSSDEAFMITITR